MKYTVAIITISDKGSRGEREDRSGPAIKNTLNEDFEVIQTAIVPDEAEIIAGSIKRFTDELNIDLIITTGGTGLGKRDVTPEATRTIIEKELPGFSEIMRMESYRITPHGIISRGICGIRNESIIINLPGSPKAASECLSFVLNALPHALSKLKGDLSDCGQS